MRFLIPVVLAFAFPAAAQAPAKPAARPVPARPAAPLTVPAVFSAERTALLKSSVDARVISVAVAEGAQVKAGAVIVKLDDREQRARVALAAQAAGSSAEGKAAAIRVQEANARLGNVKLAADKGAASSWEVRQATAAAAQAQADLRMAQDRQSIEGKRLGLERTVLEGYVVRAPFDGRVTRLNARAGSTIRKSDPVATVVDIGKLRADAYVPVRAYRLLKVGARYPVRFGAPFDVTRDAVLTYIDPVIEAGMVRTVLTIDNQTATLPSGLEARIVMTPK